MQPILIHCGELVAKRLVEILDNPGIASHVTYSCCRAKSWPESNAKASVTLKLHWQHSQVGSAFVIDCSDLHSDAIKLY